MQQDVLPSVHDTLLLRYVVFSSHVPPGNRKQQERRDDFARVLNANRPSVHFYQAIFAAKIDDREILELAYERWRGIKGQEGEAGMCWAEWLVRQGDGVNGGEVFRQAVKAVRGEAREMMEVKWREVLDSLPVAGTPT